MKRPTRAWLPGGAAVCDAGWLICWFGSYEYEYRTVSLQAHERGGRHSIRYKYIGTSGMCPLHCRMMYDYGY